MAPGSSLNIMKPASPSPSPSSSSNPPRSPSRSAPRPTPPQKQPLHTPRPSPGRKVEAASLYLPALRPSTSSTNTQSRSPICRESSFSSASPQDQEVLIAKKIDNTLSKLFEKVDDALASSAVTQKIGEVPVVRVNIDAVSSNPADDRRAEITAVIEKVDVVFSDGDTGALVPLADIEEETEGNEDAQDGGAVVRTKTLVEEAMEIKRESGWKCCPSSSPKKHTDGCMAVTRWPKENAAPTKTSAARTSSIIAYNMEDNSSKKRVDKLLHEDWVCKAHKSSPPVEDTELYVCMRCTRNRTNKADGGRRP